MDLKEEGRILTSFVIEYIYIYSLGDYSGDCVAYCMNSTRNITNFYFSRKFLWIPR